MSVVPPIVNSAYVVTCQELSVTRRPLLSAMDRVIPKLAVSGKLERIDAMDVAQVVTLLGAVSNLVDADPKNMPDESLRGMMRPLHVRQVSNGLKHQEALKRIATEASNASSSGQRFSLVVEDDVLFGEGMPSAVAAAAFTAPPDADLVFLGLPSTKAQAPTNGAASFEDPMEVFKTHILPACDSYLVTAAGAAKLAEAFTPLRFSAAGQLTYLLRKGIVKAYLSVPNAFVDGSKVGVVSSSLETNNPLLWNTAWCQMEAIVRRIPGSAGGYTEEVKSKFEELWKNNPFKENPDALVLLADHLTKSGKIEEARDAYAKALSTYERDGCIINQGSEWMRRYMATFAQAV